MYDFLLQTILFVSLGVVIYLMARAVPRVPETGEEVHAPGAFDRLLSKLPLREIDERLNVYFEKMLRHAKVFTLKFDNTLNEKLEKFRKMNGKNGAVSEAKNDLFEKVNGENHEE